MDPCLLVHIRKSGEKNIYILNTHCVSGSLLEGLHILSDFVLSTAL